MSLRVDLLRYTGRNNTVRGGVGVRISPRMDQLLRLLDNAVQLHGESVKFVNDVPYFNKLENGLSSQAPEGVITPHKAEIKAIIDKYLYEIILEVSQDKLKYALMGAAIEVLQHLRTPAPIGGWTPYDQSDRELSRDRSGVAEHAVDHWQDPEL